VGKLEGNMNQGFSNIQWEIQNQRKEFKESFVKFNNYENMEKKYHKTMMKEFQEMENNYEEKIKKIQNLLNKSISIQANIGTMMKMNTEGMESMNIMMKKSSEEIRKVGKQAETK
jgi:hypothetical protein